MKKKNQLFFYTTFTAPHSPIAGGLENQVIRRNVKMNQDLREGPQA